jgi:hypothetical protein
MQNSGDTAFAEEYHVVVEIEREGRGVEGTKKTNQNKTIQYRE